METANVTALPPTSPVQFKVLGPLAIIDGNRDCTPSAPKVLQVLALLVLRANQIVETESLILELWGENPPRSALTTIQTYVYQLRRLVEREGLADSGVDLVVTRPPGYILQVDSMQVDLHLFECLSGHGHRLLAERRHAEAVDVLRQALGLWSGSPLGNVNLGSRLGAYVAELREQQRMALQSRIQAEMELGRHRELIGELHSLVAQHPLDESLCGLLIRVLDRSGRRSDALQAYYTLRLELDEKLGLEPSPETQNLYIHLLGAN